MSTAVRLVATPEAAKDSKTPAATKGIKLSEATADNSFAHRESQRRKWGTETAAVRSVHARKF